MHKPYSDSETTDEISKNKLFVERIENLYLTEGSEFTSHHKQAIGPYILKSPNGFFVAVD